MFILLRKQNSKLEFENLKKISILFQGTTETTTETEVELEEAVEEAAPAVEEAAPAVEETADRNDLPAEPRKAHVRCIAIS